MRPVASRIGDTVIDTSMRLPDLHTRSVAKWWILSPARILPMITSSSDWSSGGISRVIDLPITSSGA